MAVFLLCLHDIGKFAKKFQAKVPNLYPVCFADEPARLSGFYDHGAGGLRLFDAEDGFLELPNGARHRTWRPLVSAVTGHHGAPPDTCGRESLATLRPDFGAAGIEAARRFVRETHDLFDIPRDMPPLRREQVRSASFALAGLAVLAGWIGSNQEWFPYREPEDFQDLGCYWNHAQERAGRAVEEAGVLPADIRDRVDYDALIDAPAIPSPMQEWARSVELPAGPALFMIEDETGSRKVFPAQAGMNRWSRAGTLRLEQRRVIPALASHLLVLSQPSMIMAEDTYRFAISVQPTGSTSHHQARRAIFEFIEGWYHPHRRHRGLGQQSPMPFERSDQEAA